jgi:uncharacterized membrane protein YeaQ/YmgE (transglycosylase-associated protein family)
LLIKRHNNGGADAKDRGGFSSASVPSLAFLPPASQPGHHQQLVCVAALFPPFTLASPPFFAKFFAAVRMTVRKDKQDTINTNIYIIMYQAIKINTHKLYNTAVYRYIVFYTFLKQYKAMEGTIISLILGAVAGWLGGQLYKGSGLGLIGNIIVGILGGFVGYWGLGKLGVHLGTGWLGYILTAAIGAVVLLALLNILVKKSK